MLKQEGLYLEKVIIKNFKNIPSFTFDFNGGSYIIVGGNAAGKSAILQAIKSPLNSTYSPLSPLKEGEEHGEVKVSFGGTVNGERKEYNTEVYFNHTTNKGRLVVKNENGEVLKSQATTMKSILQGIALDPFEFVRAKPAEQVGILKSITGLDFTELDMKKHKLSQDKTLLNASIKGKENDLASHGMSEDDMAKYEKPVDVTPINDEMKQLSEKITLWNDANNRVAKHKENADFATSEIFSAHAKVARINEEISRLQEEAKREALRIEQLGKDKAEAEAKHAAGLEWQAKHPTAPSSQEILLKLEKANHHNNQHNKVLELIKKHKDVQDEKAKLEALNASLKEIEKEKKDLLSKASIPVEGLTFDSDGVYINGIPFGEKDLNTAQQIEYGVKIAMATNPNLRLIIIQDGSLLDNKTTADIFKSCTEQGYQLLIERVRPEGGETELIFMEEEIK
jgi:predicted ATP-dependent endonuclease of OLD family